MRGTKLSAVSNIDIQGQAVEFNISAVIDGDSISGEITAPMVPAPLTFIGSREA